MMKCAKCGSAAEGKFCSQCGAALTPPECTRCRAKLAAGARFCAECGAPAGAPPPPPGPTGGKITPAQAAGAVAVIALVMIGAFQLGARTADTPPGRSGSLAGGAAGAAPDISALSPPERAARLYDRVMRLHEQRKTDSVSLFAPMALASYAAIPTMDAHARYDMARIAMVAGSLSVAQAQADTILRADSTHLLGLLLGADLARATNSAARAAELDAKLVASAARERARNLPEYEAHGDEITGVLSRLQAKR